MSKPIYKTVVILRNKRCYKPFIDYFTKQLQYYSTEKKVEVTMLGEKKLAYEIKGHTTGWYVTFAYEATPDNMAEVERLLRTNDDVLKFITIKHEDDAILEDLPKETEQTTPDNKTPVDVLDIIYNLK